jgi:Zn-dependent protease with chaperone function
METTATTYAYQIHPKEKLYFAIKLLFSLIIYAALGVALVWAISNEQTKVLIPIIVYLFLIVFLLMFRMGILVGYLRGNAIKVSKEQFPDIYDIAQKQSRAMNLPKTPDIYLLQAGGLLNAFATKFLGRNYVVLFSDILEEAYENNKPAVEFIIAHELGHIKRNHISKHLFLIPSAIIPFLGSAYSRACEYTCDSIGAAFSPKGVIPGLVLLAAGKKLYSKVNVENFIAQDYTEGGFWSWIAEKISSHPKLTKRVSVFKDNKQIPLSVPASSSVRKESISTAQPNANTPTSVPTEEHDKYMPKF